MLVIKAILREKNTAFRLQLNLVKQLQSALISRELNT